MAGEDVNISALVSEVFQWTPRNSSYVIPGLYDIEFGDSTFVMVITLIVFTMQTGFALVESGCVSRKNEVNIMMKNVVDCCFGGISWWAFGFAMMYGRGEWNNPFIAWGDFFVNPKTSDPLMGKIFTHYFFQMAFAQTATTIVSGSVAERFYFPAYMVFSFFNFVAYSIGGGWVWGEHGFLNKLYRTDQLGVTDYAGAGPIHIIGGSAALVACKFIGPRIGRFEKGKPSPPMGNPINACIGLFILWWGWIGFNAGSSYGLTNGKWDYAARGGVGTALASYGGGCYAMLSSLYRRKGVVNVFEVINGILAGLVAINAGCYLFPAPICILVGAVSAAIAIHTIPIYEKFGLDDPIAATSVHFLGGVWGHLSVALFAQDPAPLTTLHGRTGLFMGGGWYLLAAHAFSVVCLTLWGAGQTWIYLTILNKIIPIRMTPEQETVGADPCEHDIHVNNNVNERLSDLDYIISEMKKSGRWDKPATFPQDSIYFKKEEEPEIPYEKKVYLENITFVTDDGYRV